MKKEILSFVKETLRGKASPTKVMGALGSAVLGLWSLGFFIGIGFALLGISSSLAAMIIVIPIMAPLLFLAYTTPFLVLWNIRNANHKLHIILLSIGCLFWTFLVGIVSFLVFSGVTV